MGINFAIIKKLIHPFAHVWSEWRRLEHDPFHPEWLERRFCIVCRINQVR